ncbi:hypothetical protein P170DRAFT_487022 [Aspergillus steynii IBT 23096]|uniref:Uncharacterized protein n=1 Tax=Aspergillus steynii IBT 23096 TaxID=1392250 RepID=A0A2I2FQS0_9EURO|nr:uncharacterized protein P170DRAFT_487022 [Aspergillus steynii IBT 23096]PLB42959.1 hypothetical protein P170DRAFT_487022 [Aspergillus steynii IBT 23096]
MALTRRPYLPASVFPPIPPGPLRAPTGLAVGHPRSIRPGTRPPPDLLPQAPDRPVPFRSGAHPPPDLLPQAPDRPRAFSVRRPPTPGPFAPGTGPPPCLLPRAPHPPDRFASRPRPLASRDHSHPASQGTLPRQLVRQWAFVPYLAPTRQAPSTSLYSPQAPSAPTGLAVGHPRSIRPGTRPPPDRPRAFSVRRPPAPGPFAPGPLPARRGTPQPGDARPGAT